MVEAVMAENAGAYREVSAAESVEDSTEVAERVEERWVEEMEECKVADMRGDASEEEKGAAAAVVLVLMRVMVHVVLMVVLVMVHVMRVGRRMCMLVLMPMSVMLLSLLSIRMLTCIPRRLTNHLENNILQKKSI